MQIVWRMLVSFAVLAGSCLGADYFVGSPIYPKYAGPTGLIIYRLDPASNSLEKVWSLPEGDYVAGVKTYPVARTLVVAVEPFGYRPPDKLYVVPFDSVPSTHAPAIDFRGTSSTVEDCLLVDNGDGRFFLKVFMGSKADPAEASQSAEMIIDLSAHRATSSSALSADATTRLGGPGAAFSTGGPEIRRGHLSLSGDHWICVDSEVRANAASIPDSIVQMKDSYTWNLIGTESQFYVLNSVPAQSGLTSRELLICDRTTGKWGSVLISCAADALVCPGFAWCTWTYTTLIVAGPKIKTDPPYNSRRNH